MSKIQVGSHLKQGEVMFASVRFPQLSLILDAGGDVQIGDKVVNRKPRYADFSPSFCGGEFRVNKASAKRAGMTEAELLAHLRERDAADAHYVEVRDIDHLAELVAEREIIVADSGDGKVTQRGAPKAEPKAAPAPAKTEPAVPQAAKGPSKGKRKAEPVPA